MHISDWSSDVCSSDLPPLLAINARTTGSQRSEQSGFANLVRGAFGMFRNPTAHEPRIYWSMTKEDRKSTRRTPVTNAHLVCRLLLEKKKPHKIISNDEY